MPRPLTVACLQTRPQANFKLALEEALMRAEVAVSVGAELILLPEYCGGLLTRDGAFVPPAEEEKNHPVLMGLKEFAATRHVWVVIGSVAISAPDGRIFNRGFVIDNTGQVRARYDKLHLFDVNVHGTQYRESDLVKAGAEMLLVPAAFTKQTGEAHWHVLNRARAIETGSFIIAPCAVGPVDGGGESYGHSLVVNPWGEVLVDAGKFPGVVHTTIDLDEVEATRSRIPSLNVERSIEVLDGKGRAVA